LKTMIIENSVSQSLKYEKFGISRIFVDLEMIGKRERQGHLDTVISNHSISDISPLAKAITHSKLIVRINPIHSHSADEIRKVIDSGADIIMLPMFSDVTEVETFFNIVKGDVKTCLLLETSKAVSNIDEILKISEIEEIHIGLNDLHLDMKLDFMFELFINGVVEELVMRFKDKKIDYGIGGIATLNQGLVKGKYIIREHARLGSTGVILSRTFKKQFEEDESIFMRELDKIHKEYNNAITYTEYQQRLNTKRLKDEINKIVTLRNNKLS
jgi:hypothetical protein